jgi:hypothetical protein
LTAHAAEPASAPKRDGHAMIEAQKMEPKSFMYMFLFLDLTQYMKRRLRFARRSLQ